MIEYVERLKNLGYKSHEAVRIYECFKHYFNLKYLNDIVERLEKENVDKIQS